MSSRLNKPNNPPLAEDWRVQVQVSSSPKSASSLIASEPVQTFQRFPRQRRADHGLAAASRAARLRHREAGRQARADHPRGRAPRANEGRPAGGLLSDRGADREIAKAVDRGRTTD